MPLALLALLLAAAGDPPAATAPAPAPDPKAEAELAERIPHGAPKDDYGLVAWCDGVLAGHMDLAERIQDIEPLDPVQTKIGKAYLAAYQKALAASKDAATTAGRKRAAAERQVGWKNWDKARAANKELARDTYLAWQLPGVCEHAAVRLSGDQDLFRMSPTVDEVQAMGEQEAISGNKAEAAAASAAAAADSATPPALPASATADDLKIKMLPDPVGPAPGQSAAEKKAAEDKDRQDRLIEQTMHPDPSRSPQ